MKHLVGNSFTFPGGGIAQKTVNSCLDELLEKNQNELSRERIIDYCICQVYAISRFDNNYIRKWNPSHSFGKKAIERFTRNNSRNKYYEDTWLSRSSLSRQELQYNFRDRKEHPLRKFIYPVYEDLTKQRVHNTEAGFFLCQISTLLWTPFSPLCQSCKSSEKCKKITQKRFAELHRIRVEEYNKQLRL